MKKKAEVFHEAEAVGLVEQGVDYYTKEALIDMLAEHHHKGDVQGQRLLTQLPVMLARNVKDLKSLPFEHMRENKNGLWIAEEKLDEVRAKWHFGGSWNRIDSRNRSDVTYEYVEKTECLPHLKNFEHKIAGTVLDGGLRMPVSEIHDGKTQTDGWLTTTMAVVNSKPERAIYLQKKYGYCQYFIYDILFYQGTDVRQYKYKARYKLIREIWEALFDPDGYVQLPLHRVDGFKDFYFSVIARGGEGIMLKRLDWPYVDHGRCKGEFKWKKYKELDGFVTGFIPGEGEFSGLVGSLLISILDKDGHKQEVAAVQPGKLPFRQNISVADGSMIDAMYGKVYTIGYLQKTKNDRLRHAVIERPRLDKNMYDCKGGL